MESGLCMEQAAQKTSQFENFEQDTTVKQATDLPPATATGYR